MVPWGRDEFSCGLITEGLIQNGSSTSSSTSPVITPKIKMFLMFWHKLLASQFTSNMSRRKSLHMRVVNLFVGIYESHYISLSGLHSIFDISF